MRGGGKDDESGCRPEHAGLLALADKMDAQKCAIEKEHAPRLEAAKELLRMGQYAAAAALYDIVGASFSVAGLPLEAKFYAGRAAACRKQGRRRQ